MTDSSADLFKLADRVAVVIGGSRGIGLAIAQGLAEAGAAVTIANSQAEAGRAAARQLAARGLRASAVPVDVRSRSSVESLAAAVVQEAGRIDILVNSAAVIRRGPIAEASDDDWDTILGVNLKGAFLCCQVLGRQMVRQGAGKIINVSSNVSQVLQPHRGIYAISKAGVSHLTRVFALEWAAAGVQVNAIAPAPTITDLNRQFFEDHPDDRQARVASIPLGRMGAPADYVGAALFLASRASDFVTGQTYFVDGGSNLI